MTGRAAAAAGLALALALPAAARDFVVTKEPLSDEAFYRLVACAAPPGRPCTEPLLRWPPRAARDLTVSIYRIAPGYPAPLAAAARRALAAAVAEINATAAALRLRRLPEGSRAHIQIYLLPLDSGTPIRGTGRRGLDGEILEAARVVVWWREGRITDAAIALGRSAPAREVGSILLEELTQALGFMTDIRNPWYETRSIFSEDSNGLDRLGPQDRMAIRRHYPPHPGKPPR